MTPKAGKSGPVKPVDGKYVYPFSEGGKELKDLLGGKGANLAEMARLGIPVPHGFTITTDACRVYLASGDEPPEMTAQVREALKHLEKQVGRKLGDADDPLLVSVRSGAKFSMPGMMETVLDIGLNDESVVGLARQAGNEHFAWDSYRRLMQMFGKTVLGIDGSKFEAALEKSKRASGAVADIDIPVEELRVLVGNYRGIVKQETGSDFPQEPMVQLDMAIRAVFDSWNTDRARLYRRQERIPHGLGTAVNVQMMAFGNVGEGSGTGVAFTRDPGSGARGIYGDYLPDAQGEDVVAGIRNTLPLSALGDTDPKSYQDLMNIMKKLEEHYQDLCDIEFTVERGKLWMLQTRVGKRTAGAAFKIAIQLVDEGLIDMDEAVRRVAGAQLAQLMFPRFDRSGEITFLTKGMNASPGAAVGGIVFTTLDAVAAAAEGKAVILVRRETNPDDLAGMVASRGVLTSRGGKTSHAAVVARGMGKTAVCGADELDINTEEKFLTLPDGRVLREGDVVSIDGSTGEVFLGEVPVMPSAVVTYFDSGIDDALIGVDEDTVELVMAVDRIMRHADEVRRMFVRANADTPDDAARSRRMGAQGIGLCRTEHMFLGERKMIVQRLILAEGAEAQKAALDELLPLQRQDFIQILEAMDGRPVTIRLLDPPLHEFLPDLTELSVEIAHKEEHGGPTKREVKLLAAVRKMHEQNPMLGLRGVRLGLILPGLFALQVRAIAEAACYRERLGGDPRPEIMIPLVGSIQELDLIAEEAKAVVAEVTASHDCTLKFPLGTMIELPRAALTAGQIAESAEFFSFGTNDLTQTTWGFSRDDVEANFFSVYLDRGVFGVSPFESLDTEGVGRLVKMAVEEGRAVRPDLHLGVCGEHGGDPASIHFFHDVGLDYVSCSPFRVPVARLEAARASLGVASADTR
ncbi:MAG: pyruvate, phosphate dikinase [Candidatus Nanopelagicales bacterium]|nr:pyruvate, phosphate dikinase [Candidatus Nanopelagicales bacterium]MDZ4250693.1 pyruvate, phosphate dikinase [Candidatus Nanopelagicales bacterium]